MPEENTRQELSELRAQLGDLESRVQALETTGSAIEGSDRAHPETNAPDPAAAEDTFWALNTLKEQLGPAGGVLYTGAVETGLGRAEYQWARPTEFLLEADWAELAETVAALGHPLRLAILRRLLDREHTVAQLVDELELASTGVAYHHLSALQTGGWVSSPRRGSWTIPASRVVPLLAIIAALEKG